MDTFNEYQSRESGADIAHKMKQKAKNGGTIGRAPLGYLNVRDRFDGREIRTIAVDPERSPFVQLAFDLYLTGNYSLETCPTSSTIADCAPGPPAVTLPSRYRSTSSP